MTLGSLFDGSGGFPLAGQMCGIEPVWASEIEKFPIEVTKKRFPNMKHLGDVTQINGAEIEPVDIITFGSPCQDLSVAGKQTGLSGERSGLFMEAVRIIKEMREKSGGIYPAFAVWENVPGAFSSNKGEDFRKVLESLCGIGAGKEISIPRPARGKWNAYGGIMGNGFSVCWRVLDAQFWGVPQRRKRIFIVADFRGKRTFEILFKRDGLQRDFAESRKAWERVAAPAENGIGVSDNMDRKIAYSCGNGQVDNSRLADIAQTLNCTYDEQAVLCYDGRGRGRGRGDISPTITGDHNNRITDYTAICLAGNTIGREPPNGGNGVGYANDVSYTLSAHGRHSVVYPINTMVATRTTDEKRTTFGIGEENDPQFTLCANNEHAVCYALDRAAYNQGENAKYDFSVQEEQAQTIVAKGPNAVADMSNLIVRRLTPLECCRLQGFPDWWCSDIPHSDTAEYKMWGNGVVLPCVLYIMEGIAEALEGGQNG